MDAIRYFYADDWLRARPIIVPDGLGGTTEALIAPVLNNVGLDTITDISPWTHPAITVTLGVDHIWHMPGASLLGPYGALPSYTGQLGLGDTELMPGSGFWGGVAVPYILPTITQLNVLDPDATPCWQPLFGLFAYTECAGDGVRFTTDAQQVSIRLLGFTAAGQGLHSGDVERPDLLVPSPTLASARVRNGCLVFIYVDDVLLEVVDTWQHNPVANVYLLDDNPHTITVVHSGRHNPNFHPVSRPRPLHTESSVNPRLNSMLAELVLMPQAPGTFVRGTWRAVADAQDPMHPEIPATWSLYFTPPDGTEGLAMGGAGLATGIKHVGLVSGVDILVGETERLVPGESVTFTTDVLQMGIQYIDLGWGDHLGPCSYTSAPLFVGGAGDVETFLAEWFENERWGTLTLEAGDIDSDGSVRWGPPYSVPCLDQALDEDTELPGTNVGQAGLMGGPRGQYVRWTITAPAVAAALPYMRDLSLYFWTPERDLTMVTKMPLGEESVLGPALGALTGTLETFLCNTYFDARRMVAGATVHGATDEYLALYGQDFGLPQYLGEPPEAYRLRLTAAFSSGQEGGSMPFIASRLAELIFGQAQDPVVRSASDATKSPTDVDYVEALCSEAVPIGPPTLDRDHNPLIARTVRVRRTPGMPPQSYWIDMPPMSSTWPYQGLPQVPPAQIKAIVEGYLMDILNPVTSVIDLYRTAWQVTWPF